MSAKKDTENSDASKVRVFIGGVGWSKDGKKTQVPMREVKWYPGDRGKKPKRKAG